MGIWPYVILKWEIFLFNMVSCISNGQVALQNSIKQNFRIGQQV